MQLASKVICTVWWLWQYWHMPSRQMETKGRCPTPSSHLHHLGTMEGPENERQSQGFDGRKLQRLAWRDCLLQNRALKQKEKISHKKMVIFTCTPESVSWTPTCHIIILINFLCLPPHWPCALCSSHLSLLSDSLSPSIFSPFLPFVLLFLQYPLPDISFCTTHYLLDHRIQSKRSWTPKWRLRLGSASIMGPPSSAASVMFSEVLTPLLSHLFPQWFSAVSLFLSALVLRTLLWFH